MNSFLFLVDTNSAEELFTVFSNCFRDGKILHTVKNLLQVICFPFFKKNLEASALFLNLDFFSLAHLFFFYCTHPFSVHNVKLSCTLSRS